MAKALKYAKNYKKELYAAVMMVLLGVIAGIMPYFVVNKLIVEFLTTTEVGMKYIVTSGVAVVAFLVLKSVFNAIGLTFSHKAAYGTLFEMRRTFSERLVDMPLGKITENGSGFYKKKIIDDIGNLEITIAHMFVEGIPNLFIPFVVLIIIFVNDWRMGLLSLGSIPVSLAAMTSMMKIGMKNMPKYYESQCKLNNTIIEYISGMAVIKIFGQTTASYEKYAGDVENYRKFAYDWTKGSWRNMSIVAVMLPCTIVLALPIGVLMYFNGVLPLETLIFTLLLDLGIGIPMHRALMFLPYIPRLNFAVTELEKDFIGNTLDTGTVTKKPKKYDVCFEDVTFAYNGANVLENLSFKATDNSLTAIVGPSGGGKSTIAKLLVHYWDVNSGKITIGGRDIREYTPDTLMDIVSLVSQDNFLFDDSIMENIRVGNPNANDDEVYAASKAAACHEFITELPNGYFTNVGTEGGKLSGGERQRITIARAILKNAPIVILDEATAYADAENEDLIQKAINNLMSDKTIIVIAHRLQSIVEANNILVMNKGNLLASGSHSELLEECELYRGLWASNKETSNWRLEV